MGRTRGAIEQLLACPIVAIDRIRLRRAIDCILTKFGALD